MVKLQANGSLHPPRANSRAGSNSNNNIIYNTYNYFYKNNYLYLNVENVYLSAVK